ncbi:MAG: hypothetical protein IJ408_02940 [Clostridia bacterium]|nr:hypothetical protein [Clostridia bacterium]
MKVTDFMKKALIIICLCCMLFSLCACADLNNIEGAKKVHASFSEDGEDIILLGDNEYVRFYGEMNYELVLSNTEGYVTKAGVPLLLSGVRGDMYRIDSELRVIYLAKDGLERYYVRRDFSEKFEKALESGPDTLCYYSFDNGLELIAASDKANDAYKAVVSGAPVENAVLSDYSSVDVYYLADSEKIITRLVEISVKGQDLSKRYVVTDGKVYPIPEQLNGAISRK